MTSAANVPGAINMPDQPKLSVNIITYNHAGFIAKALDSVLMQRTSVPYEIIVGDDASTDGTGDIIREYQRRWPDRFRPILHDKNVGMGRNVKETLESCRGEYVAFLEGDDYWTDPDKIQLQVEYLDQHPDCAICHHKVERILWPDGTTIEEFPSRRYRVERPDPRDLALGNYIQTCSVMFRRKWLPAFDAEYQELKLGDWPLFVLLTQQGWIGYLDRAMAHYRVHANNVWNNRPHDYKIRAMERMAWYLLGKVNESSKSTWEDTILALAFKDLSLTVRSLALSKSLEKFRHFVECSVKFKKPFWIFNRLWFYYRANYVGK